MIFDRKQVASTVTIVAEIEENFSDEFSVLIYDEEDGDIWIERFEKTLDSAQKLARKLFNQTCSKYTL